MFKSVPITLVMSAATLHDISYHWNSPVTCIAKNFMLVCMSAVYDNRDSFHNCDYYVMILES